MQYDNGIAWRGVLYSLRGNPSKGYPREKLLTPNMTILIFLPQQARGITLTTSANSYL